MLERLVVRAGLAAFERSLRQRFDGLATIEDERIARPRTIERDADGALVVVSEFVPGSRLSDLLDISAERGATPGVDVALGYLLDVLPALCGLHAGAGFAHGTITPARTVLTPGGQVVLLDAIYGGALEHLRYSRRTLWTELGIATPASAGAPRLDAGADIAQVALAAVQLVVGRPLLPGEYPAGLSNLVFEVVEVAQIRGGAPVADGLLSFLQHAFPLPGCRPFASADDALIGVRELARELGAPVCQKALVDFIAEMDTQDIDLGAAEPASAELRAVGPDRPRQGPQIELDAELAVELLDAFEHMHFEPGSEPDSELDAEPGADLDTEIDLDQLSEPQTIPVREDAVPASPAGLTGSLAVESLTPAAAPEQSAADGDGKSSVRSRRAKRARSSRARKDRLRSISSAGAASPAPVETKREPWLVAPGRAAAFEPVSVATPAAVGATPLPAPPEAANLLPPGVQPAFAAPVVPPPYVPALTVQGPPPVPFSPTPRVTPGFVPSSPSTPAPALPSSAAPVWLPTPISPPRPAFGPAASGPVTVRMKDPVRPPRGTRAPVVNSVHQSLPRSGRPRIEVPWKRVAVAAGLIAMVAAGAKTFGPQMLASDDGVRPPASEPVAPAPRVRVPAAGGASGRLEIETQPAGARVLLDGKPAGETPLVLDAVAAGRHTVTFISASGSVKRTVRIEAGRTAKLDVPIFSGWVGVFAPFVLEVSEGGRMIGTTEEPRLMLSPGRHLLTLSNRDLGYRTTQTVDIEPGDVRSIRLDPRGAANLNALPWAEVWLDGKKLGDTPLANLRLPLGVHDLRFRHPQFSERRVTVTVRADAPTAVSVDMARP